MNKLEYIKDRFVTIILSLLFCIFYTLFLNLTNNNVSSILLFITFYTILNVSILIIEYRKKNRFYKNLKTYTDVMADKLYVSEVMRQPKFQEGMIVYEALRLISKNYLDIVNQMKYEQNEFREYIEIWIHQVKTPIAGSHLIIENNRNEVTIGIEEEINKIDWFVEQALYYARSTAVEKDYLIRSINLQEIVYASVKKYKASFIYRYIKVNLHDLDTSVLSDKKWIQFIVDQIVDNAIKYVNDYGCIEIYTETSENKIDLYICDDGIGIDPSDIVRVFERGYTGKSGRSNQKATGMGLYLCKKICDSLYVGIQIYMNEKTVVRITFPKYQRMEWY